MNRILILLALNAASCQALDSANANSNVIAFQSADNNRNDERSNEKYKSYQLAKIKERVKSSKRSNENVVKYVINQNSSIIKSPNVFLLFLTRVVHYVFCFGLIKKLSLTIQFKVIMSNLSEYDILTQEQKTHTNQLINSYSSRISNKKNVRDEDKLIVKLSAISSSATLCDVVIQPDKFNKYCEISRTTIRHFHTEVVEYLGIDLKGDESVNGQLNSAPTIQGIQDAESEKPGCSIFEPIHQLISNAGPLIDKTTNLTGQFDITHLAKINETLGILADLLKHADKSVDTVKPLIASIQTLIKTITEVQSAEVQSAEAANASTGRSLLQDVKTIINQLKGMLGDITQLSKMFKADDVDSNIDSNVDSNAGVQNTLNNLTYILEELLGNAPAMLFPAHITKAESELFMRIIISYGYDGEACVSKRKDLVGWLLNGNAFHPPKYNLDKIKENVTKISSVDKDIANDITKYIKCFNTEGGVIHPNDKASALPSLLNRWLQRFSVRSVNGSQYRFVHENDKKVKDGTLAKMKVDNFTVRTYKEVANWFENAKEKPDFLKKIIEDKIENNNNSNVATPDSSQTAEEYKNSNTSSTATVFENVNLTTETNRVDANELICNSMTANNIVIDKNEAMLFKKIISFYFKNPEKYVTSAKKNLFATKQFQYNISEIDNLIKEISKTEHALANYIGSYIKCCASKDVTDDTKQDHFKSLLNHWLQRFSVRSVEGSQYRFVYENDKEVKDKTLAKMEVDNFTVRTYKEVANWFKDPNKEPDFLSEIIKPKVQECASNELETVLNDLKIVSYELEDDKLQYRFIREKDNSLLSFQTLTNIQLDNFTVRTYPEVANWFENAKESPDFSKNIDIIKAKVEEFERENKSKKNESGNMINRFSYFLYRNNANYDNKKNNLETPLLSSDLESEDENKNKNDIIVPPYQAVSQKILI